MLTFSPFVSYSASADLHWAAACVDGRTSSPIGGTPFSVSYNWAKNFIMNPGATQCACNYYRNRNTGGKHWDRCPDCTFVRLAICDDLIFQK